MKRSYLCFGLLLASLITFGVSFAGSSDVNAYKYDLDYVPFVVPLSANNNGISLYDSFMVEGYDDLAKTQPHFLKDIGYYFNLNRNSASDRCSFANYYSVRSGDGFRYSIPYYLQPDDFAGSSVEDTLPWIYCQTNNALSDRLFSLNDWPVQHSDSDMKYYLPYRFNFDGAFIRSNVTSEGLNRDSKFSLGDVYDDFTDLPDYIYEMRFPLSISKIHFSAGDTLSFRGRFYLDADDPVNSVAILGSSAVAKLKTIGYSDYSDYVTYSPNLNTSVYSTNTCRHFSLVENNADNEAPYFIEYHCDVTIPNDTNIAGFTLDFSSTDSSIPFLSYPGFRFMSWDISLVLTNNNWNPDPSGQPFQYSTVHSNNLNDVPGFAGDPSLDVSTDGFNWSESFKKLFNFSFTNPFQSLFALFASDSCVQIPTLASMLHSEESSVCPWFPSGVRAIVTPVIGLSSMMLIFGFAVRWLGARSGNFVEDSGGVDSGSYHFQNKFRRKNK